MSERTACTSIIIGKKATTNGSVIIGRNEDARAAWPKHYVVHQHHVFSKPQTFKSPDNHFQMPLPKVSLKYDATPEWTDKYGVFEEDGINEMNVAMSATESTAANDTVLGADPFVKDGIGEEAMINVVLPYVKSAREGVQRLGQIIEKYGTCEANGILFADVNEAWYMETGAGHQWVAERIPDNAYVVIANQSAIENVNFNDPKHFLFAPTLKSFVKKNHLNPDPQHFNFRHIFGTRSEGDTYYNTPRVWYGQKMFNPEIQQDPQSQDLPFICHSKRQLSVIDAQNFLASHYQGTPYDPVGNGTHEQKHLFRPVSLAKTQESHVLQLRPNQPAATTGIHWLAMGVAAQSTYVPFFSGITKTPTFYHNGQHEFGPRSAYWIFKLVGILEDAHYHDFLPLVEETQSKLIRFYLHQIHLTDQKIKPLSSKQQTTLVNQVSFKNAKVALHAYQKLTAHLITLAADDSPLNYHQDLNL